MGTYQYWLNGQDDPSQVSVTYSGQFYELCQNLGAEAYVIAYNEEKKFLKDGQFTIEHRPKPLQNLPGAFYHLSQIWYGIDLIKTALQWKADVVIVPDGTTHWFLLSMLPSIGIQVIPALHCTLWRKYVPLKKSEKILLRMARPLFARCAGILSASNDISSQIQQLTGDQHSKIAEFLPLYRRSEFSEVPKTAPPKSPFRVLFMGRIEAEKGVFDLLAIAQRFLEMGRDDICFDICGTGSALDELRRAVSQLGLEKTFICHGYCQKPRIRELLGQSHVVIAPTKTDFVEGFCQAAAEGVLAHRPTITSSVCPALSYIRPAIVEVQPNDVQGYGDAILRLCEDEEFYEEKRQGCQAVQEQFYDPSRSWQAALQSILAELAP